MELTLQCLVVFHAVTIVPRLGGFYRLNSGLSPDEYGALP
jgi:hypothetical protein